MTTFDKREESFEKKFAIDEELAHRLCADLERFLTQVPRRTRTARP